MLGPRALSRFLLLTRSSEQVEVDALRVEDVVVCGRFWGPAAALRRDHPEGVVGRGDPRGRKDWRIGAARPVRVPPIVVAVKDAPGPPQVFGLEQRQPRPLPFQPCVTLIGRMVGPRRAVRADPPVLLEKRVAGVTGEEGGEQNRVCARETPFSPRTPNLQRRIAAGLRAN